jgi:hypothetical protein
MTTLREIESFMKIKQVPPTRFGREAVNDPRFVFDLRQGRRMNQRTLGRVEAYLSGTLQ